MKKKLLIGAMAFCILFCATGCKKTEPYHQYSASKNITLIHSQYFDAEIIEEIGFQTYIIRDKNTNVLYLVAGGTAGSSATMTPIYNEDGTLKTYKGDK
jgi:hypothetical protein